MDLQTTRLSRMFFRALAAGIALLCVAGAAVAGDAERVHCRPGQQAIRGKLGGHRLVVSPRRRAPILACVSPPPQGMAAQYRASERLLRDPRLVHPGLRRAHRRLLRAAPRLRRSERVAHRVGDRFMIAALRRPSLVARAARHTESGPLPGGVEDGANVTGKGLRIDPDPDEVGSGLEADYTVTLPSDRLLTTVRKLHREATFAKRCPTANGRVKGDYEFRDLQVQTNEAVGRRAIQSTDVSMTAAFEGHVNDDAELVDYDVEGEFVVEVKGRLEVAATGKLMMHFPTRVIRGRFSARGARPGANPSVGEVTRASLVGPKGWIRGDIALELYAGALGQAANKISNVLDLAEEFWRATENKETLEVGGNCVKLAFSPERLRIAPGDTKPVEVRLVSKVDGSEVAAKHRLADVTIYVPEGTTDPSSATSAPGAPAIFHYTSPDPEDPGGWFSFEERATSKRGIAIALHDAEPLPAAPRAYVGTISGYYHVTSEQATGAEDWATTDVRFEREPGTPDEAPRYDLVAGHVSWSSQGSLPILGCTSSAAATFNAVGDGATGSIHFGTQTEYVGRAVYVRQGTGTAICPDFTTTTSAEAWPGWWDSNANQGYVNTVGPNWKLEGSSDDVPNGLHWEWSLTPVF